MNKFAAVLLISTGLVAQKAPKEPLNAAQTLSGPSATLTESGEVIVWVRADNAMELRCSAHGWHGGGDVAPAYQTMEALAPGTSIFIRRYRPDDLKNLIVDFRSTSTGRDERKSSLLLDARFSAAKPGTKYQLALAFGSCAHQEQFAEHQPIWEAIAKEDPDCFLFIGDNIYLPSDPADYPKSRDEVLKLYRETYDRNRRIPELQPLLRSCYTFAIWDDHDFGPNNADRTWKWADVALQALNEYFPNDYGLPDAPGCFHKFTWGDIDVFMLDDRTWRDPNRDPQRRTMFGEKQLAWLKGGLAASKATFKLIVNGNQMLSDTHGYESWGVQFRDERDAFLRWLWDSDIRGVIFLAGDRHFAELIRKRDPLKKGEDLWELTSSPLANKPFWIGDRIPCPERRESYCGGPNFGLLQFSTVATPPHVDLKLKDQRGRTVFKRRITRLR